MSQKRRNKKKTNRSTENNVTDVPPHTESISERLKALADSSKYPLLPAMLVDISGDLEALIGRVRQRITACPDVGSANEHPVFVAIGNNWKASLDESLSFIGARKTQLDIVKKIFEEEAASVQMMCQLIEQLDVGEQQEQ